MGSLHLNPFSAGQASSVEAVGAVGAMGAMRVAVRAVKVKVRQLAEENEE